MKITDTSLLEAFFKEKELAKNLNLPAEKAWKIFINTILLEILYGHSSQRAAEQTVQNMDNAAASHAVKIDKFEYQWIGPLEDELAEVIHQTVTLEVAKLTL